MWSLKKKCMEIIENMCCNSRMAEGNASLQRPNSLPLENNNENNNTSVTIQTLEGETSTTMNSPSTISSEVEALSSYHALDIIKGQFIRDFDLRDSHQYIDDLLNVYEKSYIKAGVQQDGGISHDLQEVQREEQVSRLFAVLRHKESSEITKFMNSLLHDYNWLVSNFENLNKVDYNRYLDLVHSLRTKVHLKYDDYNVQRSTPFRQLRNALLAMAPAGRVVLVSDFGCGKKWLAIDACTDFDVAKAMNFQIHWVDMSQCSSSLEDLRMLRYLKLLITESGRSASPASYGSLDRDGQNAHVYTNSIDEVKVELKKKLDKKCLVVLVNVQNIHALKAFDLPCKLLVITRSKKVSDSFAKKFSTTLCLNRGLTREELYVLFGKYLEHTNFEEKHVERIFAHSNGHPYLLSLIAQSLRQNSKNWQSWIDKLCESDLVDDKFNAAIEKSLDSLEPKLRKAFSTTFRCFPQAIFVPQHVIAALWPERNCEKDLDKLYRHGFLEKSKSEVGEIVYKLPFIYSKMKESDEVKAEEIAEMHKKLIEYFHFVEDLDAANEVLPFQRHKHDFYFFLCIGYHLKKSGLTHYFSKLYLDYGFLEQKMRTVDLLSTIADLESYRHFIAPNSERRKVFRAIREFLPNIEKTLQESHNATLLQCALMESGLVGSEGRKQAANFPDCTWFEQRGFYHQRHNIITLPSIPKKVVLLDHERCLIVLEQSKNLLLVNTSLNWNTYSVKLKDPVLVKTTVSDVRFFSENNYDVLLALYCNGDIKYWCIPRDCSADRRRSDSFSRPQEKEIECSSVILPTKLFKPITAFELSCGENNSEPNLYLAHKSGEISGIQWKRENKTFYSASLPPLKTEMQAITIVRLIFKRYYVFGNTRGEVRIFEAIDYSQQRGLEPFSHFIELIEPSRNDVLLVCRNCIVHFTSSSIKKIGHVEYLLHEADLTAYEQGNIINCAKCLLINGRKQLALGTNSGLIIFDIDTRTKMLTTNVNEQIICVDVHPLEDVKYSYMVACGSHERKLLNLFALRVDESGDTMLGWSHRATKSNLGGDCDWIDFQLASNAWLKGGKLFAVQYECDEPSLLAVDSHNQLHKIDNDGHKAFQRLPYTITALTLFAKKSFVGCANGLLFEITSFAPQPTSVFENQPIEFLQLLDEHTLIAGSEFELAIFTDLSSGQHKKLALTFCKITRCFRLASGRMLIVFESGAFWVLDESALLINKFEPRFKDFIGDCDLQNRQLFVVSVCYRIEIFDLAESLGPRKPKLSYSGRTSVSSKTKVSCVAASRDASLLAVACYDDDRHDHCDDVRIEVYECQLSAKRLELLYHLRGHHNRINDMRFSPNAYVLVSCGEQMCWWSMPMAACKLNNTLKANEKSRQKKNNSRFSAVDSDSTESEDDETVDASTMRRVPRNIFEEYSLLPCKDTRSLADVTPVDDVGGDVDFDAAAAETVWKTKRGPIANPELLSCIKFNGNEALQFFANESFTQFQTIDNAGSYYALTLREFGNPQTVSLAPPLHKHFPVTLAYKTELSIDEAEYGEGGVDVVT